MSENKWKVITEQYTAIAGDRLIVRNSVVDLPTNPQTGDSIRFVTNGMGVNLNGQLFNGNTAAHLSAIQLNRELALTFIDSSKGWVPNINNGFNYF